MVKEYPGLFPNRVRALEHLFCVYGNGYEWKNGELVGTEMRISKKARERHEELTRAIEETVSLLEKLGGHEEHCALYRLEKKAEKWAFDNADLIASSPVTEVHPTYKFFLMCEEYSALLNIPDDVKPDWLEAAKETASLILNSNPEHECNQDCIKMVQKIKWPTLKESRNAKDNRTRQHTRR
jgi:hypothetical protein